MENNLATRIGSTDEAIMKLRTIGLISTLVFGLLALPLSAYAQEPKRIYRIGYLSRASAQIFRGQLAAFRQGLQDLGYSEGKNILIEERYAAGRSDRLPGLAAELVRLKPDIIVTHGTPKPAARAAKEAGRTIPIVFVVGGYPVVSGWVASLARPGGSITGLSDLHAHMAAKRLELLKEVVPSISRVAVLWTPISRSHPLQLKDLQAAAPAFGVTILPFAVKGPDDFDRAFAGMEKESAGGLIILGHSVIATRLRRIAEFGLKSRLASIFTIKKFPNLGGLMSYGADFNDLYRRAATYVGKILKGAKPADIPVERPRKFELVVNLKTAKQLGITIPPEVLYRATKVIK